MIRSSKVLLWLLAQFKVWFAQFEDSLSGDKQLEFIDDHVDALIEFRREVAERLALDDTVPTPSPVDDRQLPRVASFDITEGSYSLSFKVMLELSGDGYPVRIRYNDGYSDNVTIFGGSTYMYRQLVSGLEPESVYMVTVQSTNADGQWVDLMKERVAMTQPLSGEGNEE